MYGLNSQVIRHLHQLFSRRHIGTLGTLGTLGVDNFTFHSQQSDALKIVRCYVVQHMDRECVYEFEKNILGFFCKDTVFFRAKFKKGLNFFFSFDIAQMPLY